jgi:hypothetical protein
MVTASRSESQIGTHSLTWLAWRTKLVVVHLALVRRQEIVKSVVVRRREPEQLQQSPVVAPGLGETAFDQLA